MKYRLKDRELQKKLDEATDGEFSRRLQNDRERMDGMILIGCMGMIEDRRRHHHTKIQRMTLCFATDEIEEVAEYDPHGVAEYDPRAWNDYSKVNPPEGVLMRVECHDGSKACAQLRFFEREGFCRPEGLWCDIDGTPWPIADSDAVVRFRPWDDPDGEEDEE